MHIDSYFWCLKNPRLWMLKPSKTFIFWYFSLVKSIFLVFFMDQIPNFMGPPRGPIGTALPISKRHRPHPCGQPCPPQRGETWDAPEPKSWHFMESCSGSAAELLAILLQRWEKTNHEMDIYAWLVIYIYTGWFYDTIYIYIYIPTIYIYICIYMYVSYCIYIYIICIMLTYDF